MRIRRESEIFPITGETIFRQSRIMSLTMPIIMLSMFGSVTAMLWVGALPKLFWFSLVVLGLILWPIFKATAAAFRSTNWVLRVRDDHVVVKFRSHRNHHFPDELPATVEIPMEEIAVVRKRSQRASVPSDDGVTTWTQTYLEIRLKHHDTDNLREALAAERREKGPLRGRFIKSQGYAVHNPVSIPECDVIRVTWRDRQDWLSPSIRKALDLFGQYVAIDADERVERETWDKLSDDEFDDAVLELCMGGNRIDAVKLLVERRGYTTTEAHTFVRDLVGQAV